MGHTTYLFLCAPLPNQLAIPIALASLPFIPLSFARPEQACPATPIKKHQFSIKSLKNLQTVLTNAFALIELPCYRNF